MKKDINKVLLIVPPATISSKYTKEIQPPLGLAYIAAVLEKEYEVMIVDAACEGWHNDTEEPGGLLRYGLSFEEISGRINDFRPDVVGVSCLFSMQHKNARRVIELAKEVDKDIFTVMGGSHPTVLARQVISEGSVDAVIIGEGEESTKELLRCLREGAPLSNVDGIAFADSNGISATPKTRFINDLDSLPFPARHLLPMEKYFRINLPHGVSSRYSPNTPVITSRGCPANCIFCSIHSIWGHAYRARSADNVIAELEGLKKEYGVKEVQFEDDNITFDKSRAMELFGKMIERKLNLSWATPNGVSLWNLDRELLQKMRESGCYRLCLAVESGSQKVLSEIIKKPLSLQKVRELMPWIKKYGFETDAFFVVGFPDETREQLKDTFRFAESLNSDNTTFYAATPYPGTRLYEECRKEGLLPADFSLSRLGVKTSHINTRHISRQELEKEIAYHTLKMKITLLWRNPKAFYRKVIKRFIKTPRQFFSLLKDAVTKILRA